MLTGLTENTAQNLQLNAGVLLTTYSPTADGGTVSSSNIICAARGGSTFTATPETHNVEVDGVPTSTKGLVRLDGWDVKLSLPNCLEFTPDTIMRALPGSTKVNSSTSGTVYTTISASHTIAAGDYKDIWFVGTLGNGKNIAIELKNTLNLSGLTITYNNKGEGTFPLELTAHYDVSSTNGLNDVPFEIYIEGVLISA